MHFLYFVWSFLCCVFSNMMHLIVFCERNHPLCLYYTALDTVCLSPLCPRITFSPALHLVLPSFQRKTSDGCKKRNSKLFRQPIFLKLSFKLRRDQSYRHPNCPSTSHNFFKWNPSFLFLCSHFCFKLGFEHHLKNIQYKKDLFFQFGFW